MKNTYYFTLNIAVLSIVLLIWGCSTTQVVSQKSIEHISNITKIILTTPVVEYIDVETGNPSSPEIGSNSELHSILVTTVRSELKLKKIAVMEVSEISDVDVTKLSEDLGHTYRTIKRRSSPLDVAQKKQLLWLSETTGASHLMFCRCRLFTGPGSFWDPIFTGAIASDSSRIVLEFHLYDVQGHRVVWSQYAQERASTENSRSSVLAMIPQVFKTFETQ